MNVRKLALMAHVSAALGLLGVSTVLLVAGVHAGALDDTRDAHAVYALLRLVTVGLDLPLAAVTLLSGTALALTSNWGLFRHKWVVAKLALFAATLVLGVAVIRPSIDLLLDVTQVGALGEQSASTKLIAAAGAQVAMLLAAAALGVYKPGRRARWPRLARGAATD